MFLTKKAQIRADDGSILEVKEGVVLDRQGEPVNSEPHSEGFGYSDQRQARVHVWKAGPLAALLIPVLAPIFAIIIAFIGFAAFGGLFTILLTVVLAIWLLRSILKLFSFRS
ncbi:MAG: hypothetical protein A2428_11735 [Bdellovibrionales bacterium RIFOXYC1_FULL_54_43]|nr:MAG: hypothetical protein A2428_11735 [Bdellovibrionales bacterium RIFOXYC1_FULL_54_43]OFZ81728.1 MAG: hypothetical protein A2603_09655 [Bdellovibrionales bacterium RIFOXYD1_FULL_55_31]